KVGPKTAAKWLTDYDTLEGVIAAAADVKGKVGENLRESLHFLPLSKQLTTIKTDVVLDFDLDSLAPKPPDTAKLRSMFDHFEFRQWVDELTVAAPAPRPIAPIARNYTAIFTLPELDRWIERVRTAPRLSLNVKTLGAEYMSTPIVGFAMAIAPGEATYVPTGHDYPGAPDQLTLAEALARLKPLLEDAALEKVGHNLKFDKNVLNREAITLDGLRFDTMLESYVIDSVGSRHNLDDLASRHLGVRTIRVEEIAGKGVKQLPLSQVGVDAVAGQAAEEADIALQLHDVMWPKVAASAGLKRVFETIEMPLIGGLPRMECAAALAEGRLRSPQT